MYIYRRICTYTYIPCLTSMKTLEENFWFLKTWGSQKTLYPLKQSETKVVCG